MKYGITATMSIHVMGDFRNFPMSGVHDALRIRWIKNQVFKTSSLIDQGFLFNSSASTTSDGIVSRHIDRIDTNIMNNENTEISKAARDDSGCSNRRQILRRRVILP